MLAEPRDNFFGEFNFALLNDPEFREDSVREELILPILKSLGYSPEGQNRLIRSRRLKHPFISIGSKRKRIELVPDYLFEVSGKLAWVLDAKSPTEDLDSTKHLEQCYSYAIHPEIRVPYFALCNGHRFVLYHVSKPRPILDFPLIATTLYLGDVKKLLSPQTVLEIDLSLKKDFGLHLKRLGFDTFESLYFPLVPVVSVTRMSEDLYSFSTGLIPYEDETYLATFDFDREVFTQLEGKIPATAIDILNKPLDGSMNMVQFLDAVYRVTVECKVGEKLEENDDELFLPLRVKRFVDHNKNK